MPPAVTNLFGGILFHSTSQHLSSNPTNFPICYFPRTNLKSTPKLQWLHSGSTVALHYKCRESYKLETYYIDIVCSTFHYNTYHCHILKTKKIYAKVLRIEKRIVHLRQKIFRKKRKKLIKNDCFRTNRSRCIRLFKQRN